MAAYRYSAFDLDGRRCSGVVSADSAKQARSQLREQGLLIDLISEVANETQASSSPKTRRPKISRSDLAILTQQLATLLAAGLPLERSLSALIEQAPRDSVREVMAGVRAGVNEGETLAKALGRYGEIFSPLYRALIEAGEMSGELPKIVERLAIYSENVESFRQKTLLALLYPAIVSVVAILLSGVCGATAALSFTQCCVPSLTYKSLRKCQTSVVVPTVLFLPPRESLCSMATVGGMPYTASTSGLPAGCTMLRA